LKETLEQFTTISGEARDDMRDTKANYGYTSQSSSSFSDPANMSVRDMKKVLRSRVRQDIRMKKGDSYIPEKEFKRNAALGKFNKSKGKGPPDKGKGRGKGKGKGKFGKDKGKSGQAAEMAAIMSCPDQSWRCRYWNTSQGCRQGAACQFKHECMKCGDKNHKYVDRH